MNKISDRTKVMLISIVGVLILGGIAAGFRLQNSSRPHSHAGHVTQAMVQQLRLGMESQETKQILGEADTDAERPGMAAWTDDHTGRYWFYAMTDGRTLTLLMMQDGVQSIEVRDDQNHLVYSQSHHADATS